MTDDAHRDFFSADDGASGRGADARAPTDIPAVIAALVAATAGFSRDRSHDVDGLTTRLLAVEEARETRVDAALRGRALADACFYYQRVGCSFDGIPRGIAARDIAVRHELVDLERRASNVLGSVYMDTARFDEACLSFERALQLARRIGDPFLVAVAYSMSGALFKEMGCYRDAMAMIDRALTCDLDTAPAGHARFASATNGLFCAHRLRDEPAALRYMGIAAAESRNPLIDDASLASFEYHRAIYLVTHDDVETADELVAAAVCRPGAMANPRAALLLGIAVALCGWASRVPEREVASRLILQELHRRSKASRLHHDEVLRALMQVHGRPRSGVARPTEARSDANIAMAYARELVEYTTSVKHAKFYRQLGERATGTEDEQLDPIAFVRARNWLVDAIPREPAVEQERFVASDVQKHDELTAIHDDLAAIRTASLKRSIRTTAYDMAENWALAAEFFDDQTGQHCFRVGRLSGLLAREIGKDEAYCVRIEHAARLHDIGKITVNELILLKPGPLDPGELTAMRTHAEAGGFLLQHSDDPTLRMAAVIARHHHEWWNGTGYPHALTGERIPLEARICALADVYDALSNARPYKRAWPHRNAIEQMMCERGVHFDPTLMTPFLRVLERALGAGALSPSSHLHLQDMEANGLIASRRQLLAAIDAR